MSASAASPHSCERAAFVAAHVDTSKNDWNIIISYNIIFPQIFNKTTHVMLDVESFILESYCSFLQLFSILFYVRISTSVLLALPSAEMAVH
jgi:hypothetical protein